MPEPTILTLIRHGETSANQDGVWHGSTDTPLTELGAQQAERVAGFCARELDTIHAIYSSDLQRARHTAEPIARMLGLSLRVESDLREFDLGAWEGKSYKELFEVHELWHHLRRDPNFAPHGGETPLGAARRLTGAMQRIVAGHSGERVVVVSHGGVLSMALGELLDGDYSNWRRVMDNAAVSELAFDPAPSLLRFNLRDHLEDG